MAATVMRQWPAGVISTLKSPGEWGYEEGVLLDGMFAEWQQSGNPAEFAYVKAAVDRYLTPDGAIQIDAAGKPYRTAEHTLDDVELGRAILAVDRVAPDPRYAAAAKFLEAQLALQPRTPSGGYWHKQIYPNQMWLDGAYMAEPFRAAYAAMFQQPRDFDDIARQLLLMDEHMRDPSSGLLRHGWDESKQMPWADKQTGLSPAVWARAMGWYCVALVDTLDWFPKKDPQWAVLVLALKRIASAVLQYQDLPTGLWWQVMDAGPDVVGTIGTHAEMQYEVRHPAAKGNFLEASASAMFVYSLAKGVRLGYLPRYYKSDIDRGWAGIQKQFITTSADGSVTLTGTVKVGGLGGKPYRSGTPEYYYGEKTGDQDAKGVGAYLMAASEMARAKK
jgi:unsaturated rhamnogalacturonyl hydrolase